MKVISKMDFSWDNIQFKRGGEYEITVTDKFREFIKCGYLSEVKVEFEEIKEEVTEQKELKEVKKTKEFKGNRKTK